MKKSFKKLNSNRDHKGRFAVRGGIIKLIFSLIIALLLALALVRLSIWAEERFMWNGKFVSPVVEGKEYQVNWNVDVDEEVRKAIPNMVEMSAERFTDSPQQKNYVMYQLFCLLKEESNFGENKNCGDSGKSCGILQFREATYNRIRKEMIRKGLVTEMGDRFSPFYSIETTAYALTQGYSKEWGPIKIGICD